MKLSSTLSVLLHGAAVAAIPAANHSENDLVRRATSFWYANMDHSGQYRGYAPDLDPDFSYPVFMAATAGDGSSIQRAINAGTNGGTRHPEWLASQPRVVYIPPGTYTISQTIRMNTDTILMGDATNPPIIKASASWSGDATLVSGQDPATGVSGELSFAVGLKNLVLDTTSIPGGNTFTALWWGVAQAAQLQNVRITMASSVNGQGHTGIQLGRGSTLGLADVRVERGQNGIWVNGHQQALFKSIYFYQNTVGMLITGGNTFSIIAPTFDTCGTGVHHTSGSAPWIALIDAKSVNSGVTFITDGYPSFVIENLSKDTNSDVARVPSGTVLGAQSHVNTFSYGNTVGRNPVYGATTSTNNRPAALAPGGNYPVLPAPNYANNPVTDFINVKDPAQNGGHTVLGDHSIDESGVLNQVLQYAAANNKIAYFPFGKYRVDSTLLIPKGSRIVGEAWATITGNGAFFKDSNNPKPVVAVGNGGDVGTAQIQDMRFTVSDVLPGAIIVQFNMAGSSPGQVALWNSLVTVGGTLGASALTNTCTDPSNECKAAFIGMHFAPTSSAYVENVWNWVADHMTEGSGGSSIAAKGGALVEATKGTWIHALGSEHWWLYQLNLRKASNVLVSLLQTETNYDQGDHVQQTPPAPWVADVTNWGDPDFSWCGGGDTRCRMGFANYINGGSNIYTYASASWAFFSGPGYQSCAGAYQCQNVMHWIQQTPSNLQAFGLCSKDTWATLRLADGTNIQTQGSFQGSWPGTGGDVGRYTP
ncbi:glycoside hydrolase family 55 protein [Coniochaeta sp. PMI_546]|nr:glycoside hydrolase family 55 protein [Coniochaeta sp. PMI_546]